MTPVLEQGANRIDARGSDDPAFTRRLCHTHRVWAVDATWRENLPIGWHGIARELFGRIAVVMVGRPVGMLVVRSLGEEGGSLAADICPLGDSADVIRAFRAVRRLVELARRTSEATCSMCGEPGRTRSAEGWCATRCEAHAGEVRTPRRDVAVSRSGAGEALRHAVVAPDHRLYELDDVESALGRRMGQGASLLDGLLARDVDTEQQAYLRALLASGEAGCLRTLACPCPSTLTGLDDLHARAPHMAEVTDLVRRHLEAASVMGLPTSLPPIMLLGEPGTGKSWYLSRLAALLGVPHLRYPMSGQSLADGLVGASPTWRNARPGLVARGLLAERVANPLVLVDEVDKARSHAMEDPYRGFYDLLEPEGARNFVDEYLGFPLDASRVLWMLAGNDLSPLPAPIVDRLTVVAIPTPGEVHLRAVADSVYQECNGARLDFFRPSMDEVVTARLLETNPRGIRKALTEAMTRAAADGRRALSPDDVVVPTPPRRGIGFR